MPHTQGAVEVIEAAMMQQEESDPGITSMEKG